MTNPELSTEAAMSEMEQPPKSPDANIVNEPVPVVRANDVSPATEPAAPTPNSPKPAVAPPHEMEGNQPELRGPLPLRFRDQVVFAVASAIALVFMTIYCVRTSRWGTEPIELERQPQRELDFKIDLNDATWVEWSQLPGIGPVLAQRIVEDREQNGPFRNVDDLDRVKGIGRKKIDAVRPFVRVDSKPAFESDDHRE